MVVVFVGVRSELLPLSPGRGMVLHSLSPSRGMVTIVSLVSLSEELVVVDISTDIMVCQGWLYYSVVWAGSWWKAEEGVLYLWFFSLTVRLCVFEDPTSILGYVGRFLSKISFIQQFIFAQLSV